MRLNYQFSQSNFNTVQSDIKASSSVLFMFTIKFLCFMVTAKVKYLNHKTKNPSNQTCGEVHRTPCLQPQNYMNENLFVINSHVLNVIKKYYCLQASVSYHALVIQVIHMFAFISDGEKSSHVKEMCIYLSY